VGSFQLDCFIISSILLENISIPNGHLDTMFSVVYSLFACAPSLLNSILVSRLSASEISFVSFSYPKMSFSKSKIKKKGP